MTKRTVFVNEPVISTQATHNVNVALKTGWLSSSGPFVSQFEQEFAAFVGVKHGVAVSNGTAALHTALLALGIKAGDEVIVPAFTMGSSWMAVLHAQAKPVFIDCELETYNIDPNLIEERITSRTRAIMAIHIYGHPADMGAIALIAKKHNLKIIEDAAEAHGATYKNQKCGSFGDISCFSFYANKLIAAGEGGMVLTDDDQLAEEARRYRDLYHSPQKRFIHEQVGYNYRMGNLQAAVGLGELQNIAKYIAKKQHMAKLYSKLLGKVPGVILPKVNSKVTSVYWMYGIRIDPEKFGLDKDLLRWELKEKGIDTRDFFYPPPMQPVLRRLRLTGGWYTNADLVAKSGFYLPSGLAITDSQIRYVAKAIQDIQRAGS